MSRYSNYQKQILYVTGSILLALILLPATYAIYTVSERAGGLVRSVLACCAFVTMMALFKVGDFSGDKKFLEQLKGNLLTILIYFLIPTAAVILSYAWKIAGVPPFGR